MDAELVAEHVRAEQGQHKPRMPVFGRTLVRYWPSGEVARQQLEDTCLALAELEAEAADVTSQHAQTCRLAIAVSRGYAMRFHAMAVGEGLETRRGQAYTALVGKHIELALKAGAALRAEVEAARRDAAADLVAEGRELFSRADAAGRSPLEAPPGSVSGVPPPAAPPQEP